MRAVVWTNNRRHEGINKALWVDIGLKYCGESRRELSRNFAMRYVYQRANIARVPARSGAGDARAIRLAATPNVIK